MIRIKSIIFALVLTAIPAANDMFLRGTYDLDEDNLSEILLFSSNQIRYVEIQIDGSHTVLWELSPHTFSVADVQCEDINKDGFNELIIFADLLPDVHGETDKWILIYSWNGIGFDEAKVNLFNGDVLHPTHSDFDRHSGFTAVTVGSPARSVKLLTFSEIDSTFFVKTTKLDLPEILHNGVGHIFSKLIHLNSIPHLAVFSPEAGKLKTALIPFRDGTSVIENSDLNLNGARTLLGSAVLQTYLNGESQAVLQLPFSNGDVFSLKFSGDSIRLNPSQLSGQNLFSLSDSANSVSINSVLRARIAAGLMDEIYLPDEAIITGIIDDTLKLGDTLKYKTAPDSANTFYKFQWQTAPPERAFFNPNDGQITWMPTRDQLGIHFFNFLYEQKLKEKLLSDMDALGDRHRMVAVVDTTQQFFSVLVIDTIPPPLIYIPPPDEPYTVSVVTSGKNEGNERFTFSGEYPFSLIVDEHPLSESSILSHEISANLGNVTIDKNVVFSYASFRDSVNHYNTLTIDHDLAGNTFFVGIEPPVDRSVQELNPGSWRTNFDYYPLYLFDGFPTSIRLDERQEGLTLYKAVQKKTMKKKSVISIQTPLKKKRHTLNMHLGEIDLLEISGHLSQDSTGRKHIRTTILFTGMFEPKSISTEMIANEKRMKNKTQLKYQMLEFMGVDSVAGDSTNKWKMEDEKG